MLGKTNINTLKESTIVTEIEDYRWIQMQSGVFGDFVKAIYQNGYLAAITANGKVVYTVDGEVWNTYVFEYEDCELNDIEWDGSRFILAGNYRNADERQTGLLAITSDFVSYEKKEITSEQGDVRNYYAVYTKKNGYIVFVSFANGVYVCIGNMEDEWKSDGILAGAQRALSIAKNSREIIVGGTAGTGNYSTYNVVRIVGDTAQYYLVRTLSTINYVDKVINVFEIKDELYYISMLKDDKFRFARLLNSGEDMLISSEINFMFVDGVYFNECLLFINSHEMLIVKKGESIEDKTLDDLIEIAPEFTMNCITKAFGQLYIFGNRGVILRSSAETDNEEAIAVQTLSAKKALAEARIYTDERYAELEARVAALEALKEQ